MRVRFLQTTPSDQPEFPFQAGQIIQIEHLDEQFHVWKREGRIQVLDAVLEDAALELPEEVAVEPRPKPRGRR